MLRQTFREEMTQCSKLDKESKRLNQQVQSELTKIASLQRQQYNVHYNGTLVKKEKEL